MTARESFTFGPVPLGSRDLHHGGRAMRVAHFVQRYPPALGGSEASFARLSRYLTAHGAAVTVHATTALDLEAFWRFSARTLPAGNSCADGVDVRRYGLLRWPGRRYF